MSELINKIQPIFAEYQTAIKIIAGILIFLIFLLLRRKLSGGILKLISSIIFRKKEEHKQSFVESLIKPLAIFFVALGAFLAFRINTSAPVVVRSFKIATILIVSWAIVSYLSENLYLLFKFGNSTDDKLNATVIKFVANILKIVIIAISLVMVVSELGYNINGLLTGIGVGGLAVSLAAQDAISNLISGLVIVLDKPFLVGDFVQTSSIQGTVVDITMRSTKIRTLDDCVVTVPNSKMADGEISNISSIRNRLIEIDLSLIYSTSNELLEKCKEDILEYLKSEENILDFPLRVNFSKLDDSSLNLSIFCYTPIVEVNDYLKFVSDVNFKLKEIIEANGAEFAFPSTSVYIEKK